MRKVEDERPAAVAVRWPLPADDRLWPLVDKCAAKVGIICLHVPVGVQLRVAILLLAGVFQELFLVVLRDTVG